MRSVHLQHDYPVDPERLWALVTDFAALTEVMAGLATFTGLPQGRARTGQRLEVQVRLFGWLPPQPYVMEVLECDDGARRLRSSETGMGVHTWRHSLWVETTAAGARLSETIEIDAGWRTIAFTIWARFMYRARHKPRLRLLAIDH